MSIWHLKTDLAQRPFWQEVTQKVSKEKKGQTINPWIESYYPLTLGGNSHNLCFAETQHEGLYNIFTVLIPPRTNAFLGLNLISGFHGDI